MEVSAIGNSPAPQQKKAKKGSILKSAIGGATIGAAVNGVQAVAQQKAILKNGDVFLKEIVETMNQIPDPVAKEEFAKIAEATEQFIKGGKLNMKAVGMTALKGAAMFGLVFAGFEVISNIVKKAKAKKAQPKQV